MYTESDLELVILNAYMQSILATRNTPGLIGQNAKNAALKKVASEVAKLIKKDISVDYITRVISNT